MEWQNRGYVISNDRSRINIEVVHNMLSQSYWAKGRKKETIKETINNSLNFGMYQNGKQIGYARVVTDKAVFSWVMDVIIHEDYRSLGLGKWLIECILEHPDVAQTSVRLATKDAHSFYGQFGFKTAEMLKREKSV